MELKIGYCRLSIEKICGERARVHYVLFAISKVLLTVQRIRLSFIFCTPVCACLCVPHADRYTAQAGGFRLDIQRIPTLGKQSVEITKNGISDNFRYKEKRYFHFSPLVFPA
jgi:hypothetical protein